MHTLYSLYTLSSLTIPGPAAQYSVWLPQVAWVCALSTLSQASPFRIPITVLPQVSNGSVCRRWTSCVASRWSTEVLPSGRERSPERTTRVSVHPRLTYTKQGKVRPGEVRVAELTLHQAWVSFVTFARGASLRPRCVSACQHVLSMPAWWSADGASPRRLFFLSDHSHNARMFVLVLSPLIHSQQTGWHCAFPSALGGVGVVRCTFLHILHRSISQ